MEDKISVIIVDDHHMVRLGLRNYLETLPDIEVSGETSNGHDAVDLVQQLQPDVVLMDLVMEKSDGITATEKLQNENCRIVVLTSYLDDDKVFPALKAGAMSYILKTAPPEEIAQCIRKAYRGEAVYTGKITELMLNKQQEQESINILTNRELEVLALLSHGYSNNDIAEELHIGIKTVKTHVSNILDKLELKDRTQAAIFARDKGINK